MQSTTFWVPLPYYKLSSSSSHRDNSTHDPHTALDICGATHARNFMASLVKEHLFYLCYTDSPQSSRLNRGVVLKAPGMGRRNRDHLPHILRGQQLHLAARQ
jgi:hypothetical protein